MSNNPDCPRGPRSEWAVPAFPSNEPTPPPIPSDTPTPPPKKKRKKAPQTLLKGFFAPLASFRSVFWLFFALLIGPLTFLLTPLFYLFYLSLLAVRIFERTADGSEEFTSFPEFDLWDGLVHYLWFALVSFLASLPGVLMTVAAKFILDLFPESAGVELAGVIVNLVAVQGSYLLFAPILFLGGMANESPFSLYSSEVLRSLRDQKKVWTRFYLLSLLLWVTMSFLSITGVIFLAVFARPQIGVTANVLFGCVVLLIFTLSFTLNVLLYFRLLGRLALIIGRKMTR